MSQPDEVITTNTGDSTLFSANVGQSTITAEDTANNGGMDSDSLTSTGTTATLASTVSLGAFGGNNAMASDCEYLKLVSGFKRTLVIPDAFFLNVMPLCYCSGCLAGSANGGGASTNATLKGWVRFTINQFVTNVNQGTSTTGGTSSDSNSDWTTAFYLTRVNKIRSILDHGQPMPIGKCEITRVHCFVLFSLFCGVSFLNLEPYEGTSCHQKDDSGPGAHLILSSSPNASNKPQTTFAHRYMSGSTVYTIGTAFEVRVRTQSLCAPDVGDDDASDSADSGAASSSIQMWTTKEAGACVLTAVLLKLEPVDIVEESLY